MVTNNVASNISSGGAAAVEPLTELKSPTAMLVRARVLVLVQCSTSASARADRTM